MSILSTNFCAVPDLSRVEPVNASGPTTGEMAIWAISAIGESGLHESAMVVAPKSLAYSNAPIT
ncbi:Uncharacterised protein [Vibrio cholerae]|nr:Uncharacterised protein [Vibrio cholerae]